jgi:hypothetical protein
MRKIQVKCGKCTGEMLCSLFMLSVVGLLVTPQGKHNHKVKWQDWRAGEMDVSGFLQPCSLGWGWTHECCNGRKHERVDKCILCKMR